MFCRLPDDDVFQPQLNSFKESGPSLQDDQRPLELQPHHSHGPRGRHPDPATDGPAHHPGDGWPGGPGEPGAPGHLPASPASQVHVRAVHREAATTPATGSSSATTAFHQPLRGESDPTIKPRCPLTVHCCPGLGVRLRLGLSVIKSVGRMAESPASPVSVWALWWAPSSEVKVRLTEDLFYIPPRLLTPP